MSVSISMILLRERVDLPVGDIERELRARYPDLEVSTTADESGTASFKLRTGDLILGNMPVPMPWPDLEGPCAASILWKNAADEIRTHRGHIIVTITSKLGEVDQSILLTQATAAVLAACDTAIGVYWGNAPLVVPKAIFVEFAEKVLPLGPPLDVWVDFRVGKETATTSGGFTSGLVALGHMEMEAQDSPEKPSELRQRFHDLARYVLENGAVIRDGDTVGQDAAEKIRVVHVPSAFGHPGKVMRLQYETSSGRSWWKFW